MCTYENCTESDQQYDNMNDWLNHENNLHRGPKQQTYDFSMQPSDLHNPCHDPGVSSSNPQYSNRLDPNSSWRDECPICLKSYPSFSHVAFHLRNIAVFALPTLTGFGENILLGDRDSNAATIDDQNSVSSKSGFSFALSTFSGFREDILPGDQDSTVANIDDPNSVSSKSSFEKGDKDDMHENETRNNLKDSDSRASGDAVPVSKIGQEDIQRFEDGVQQTSKSTEKGIGMNAIISTVKSFFTTPEPDSALLSRGESKESSPASVIGHLNSVSFYVRIEAIEPNYLAQPIRHGPYWAPPNIRTGFTRRETHFFRWFGGVMTTVTASDPVISSIHHVFSAATIFTQSPDTPHLLVVPFDAQRTHAYQNDGGWKPLYFHHVRINNTQYTYSAVSAVGDRQYIAAPGSPHWMPQLLPKVYDFQTGSPRIQAGLIGSIPLLIALAAFSAPPHALAAVLTNCLRPGTWRPHQYQYPAGRKFRRSMVFHQLIETRHYRERHGRHHFCRSSESSRI